MKLEGSLLRSLRGVGVGAVLLSALSFAAPSMAASDAERAAARTAANEGFDAFEQKRWADVLSSFKRAESLVHSPVHVLFIARAEVQLGQLVEAHEAYSRLLHETIAPDAPAAFREAQNDAKKEAEALEPRVPSLTIVVEGAGSNPFKVSVDGADFPTSLVGMQTPMNPGDHKIQATSGSDSSEVQTVSLAEGANQKVTLTLHGGSPAAGPAPGPGSGAASSAAGSTSAPAGATQADTGVKASTGGGGAPIAAYAAFGVGAVGLALGTVFAIKAHGKFNDANALCTGPGGACPIQSQSQINSLDDSGKSAKTLAIVGFAVGGVGIGAGVVLLLTGGKKHEEATPTASVTPWVGLGSAGLRGRF